jgi:hypothetical protein
MELENARRHFMARHLAETDPARRESWNLLVQNINGMIRDPDDVELRRQFLVNLKNHNAA